MSVTFHHPQFDKNIKGKVGTSIQVGDADGGGRGLNIRCLRFSDSVHAIAVDGFSSKKDGTHVFVTQVEKTVGDFIVVGWTKNAAWVPERIVYPGDLNMLGCGLNLYDGSVLFSDLGHRYFPNRIARTASEVVSILTISENGKKASVQWVVDGNEGRICDASDCFGEDGDLIFPVVGFLSISKEVKTIPFSQLKSTSPKIEELKNRILNPVAPLPSSSSTNNEENEKLIQELRREVDEGNRKLFEQKEKQIQLLQQQHEKQILELKEESSSSRAILQQQLENSNKQLELERAEHQKTRNLLHQSIQEMKDMEIHFLKEQNKVLTATTKESGQRRQREKGDDEIVQVKQERTD